MAARPVVRKALGLGGHGSGLQQAVEHGKSTLFFREVCRTLPWIVHNYKLEELTTVSQLRRNVNQLFRRFEEVKTPEAVDLLIYKGREELEMIIMQHKQRHHLIDKYVGLPATTEPKPKPDNLSPFLAQFYLSN
ncbi:NUOB14 [Auxenochlorella protothecoides x Auxenochlorella symbiontica]